MNQISKIIFALSVTAAALYAQAHQLGQGGCHKDIVGQIICSPPNGGIQKDALDQIVCGKGQCIRDVLGQIVCSSQSGGYATKDALGQVVCTGGCESASTANCQRPK